MLAQALAVCWSLSTSREFSVLTRAVIAGSGSGCGGSSPLSVTVTGGNAFERVDESARERAGASSGSPKLGLCAGRTLFRPTPHRFVTQIRSSIHIDVTFEVV